MLLVSNSSAQTQQLSQSKSKRKDYRGNNDDDMRPRRDDSFVMQQHSTTTTQQRGNFISHASFDNQLRESLLSYELNTRLEVIYIENKDKGMINFIKYAPFCLLILKYTLIKNCLKYILGLIIGQKYP